MSILEGARIIEVFFLKKIYENFVRTLETVRNREMSVIERCRYIREVSALRGSTVSVQKTNRMTIKTEQNVLRIRWK